jgi:hypothetical protein
MMAQADFSMSPIGAPGRKPKTSIYTIMLIISLVALLVGMLFLYLEIRRFGGFGTVRGRVAAAEPMPLSLDVARILAC